MAPAWEVPGGVGARERSHPIVPARTPLSPPSFVVASSVAITIPAGSSRCSALCALRAIVLGAIPLRGEDAWACEAPMRVAAAPWYRSEQMDVRDSFRGPFVEVARRRHGRVAELIERPDAAQLRSAASELHCLSGEAAMLDFGRVADIARQGEKVARDGDRAALRDVLTALSKAIQAVAEGGDGR